MFAEKLRVKLYLMMGKAVICGYICHFTFKVNSKLFSKHSTAFLTIKVKMSIGKFPSSVWWAWRHEKFLIDSWPKDFMKILQKSRVFLDLYGNLSANQPHKDV